MKIIDKLLWPIAPALILVFAIIGVILSILSEASLSASVFLFVMVVFLGVLAWILAAAFVKQGPVMEGVMDSLLVWIRKYENQAFGLLLAFFLAFVLLSVGWAISIFSETPEETVTFIKSTFGYEIGFLILTICWLLLVVLAKMQNEPRLTEDLGKLISPEFIEQQPQAAIEHAFTFFEHTLRNRVNPDSGLYGESLINEAFGSSGKLAYSAVKNEQQGIRNLMSGAYAMFRNPRKHRLIEDDKLKTRAIIVLVDLLTHLVVEINDDE